MELVRVLKAVKHAEKSSETETGELACGWRNISRGLKDAEVLLRAVGNNPVNDNYQSGYQ